MKYSKYKNKKVETPKKQEYYNDVLDDLMALSTGDITANNALKNSDIIFACVNLIASTIAKMSVNLFETDDSGAKTKLKNDVTYLLKVRANENTSAVDFIQTMVANMLLYGNAYALIETRKGVPTALKILDNGSTSLQKVRGKYYIQTMIDDVQKTFDYSQVIHIKDLSSDGILGVSRIDSLKNKLKNNTIADEKLGNLYTKEGQASIKGILNLGSELSVEAKKRLKKGFNSVLNSDDSGIAILDSGISFQQMNRNTSILDNSFIDSLKLNKEAIAMIFNIPLPMLGDTSNTSYSNMSEMNRNFIQSLIPIINKFEQEFNYKLLSKEQSQVMFFKFNFSTALRASDEERSNFYKKMVDIGAYSINDVLDLEDMNRIEHGDAHRVDLNHVDVEIAGDYQLSKAGADEKGGGEDEES